MKTTKYVFLLMTILFLFLITGCSNNIDKAIGYYKSEKEFYHGTYSKTETLIIEKNSISFSDGESIPVKFEVQKNGNIQVIKKDSEMIFCIITPKENGNLELKSETLPFDGVYIRTTKEDVEAIIKSPGTEHEKVDWLKQFRGIGSTVSDKP